jgi:hypothetical protein
MNKSIIRLRPHPADPERVDILAGPDTAKTMGGFEPARWIPNRRCYELHTDHLDKFMIWARIRSLHVVNEPRPYQPDPLTGHCPCHEPDCTRNRTITPAQAEINEWGAFKVQAALDRARGNPLTVQQCVALAELDAWVDPKGWT